MLSITSLRLDHELKAVLALQDNAVPVSAPGDDATPDVAWPVSVLDDAVLSVSVPLLAPNQLKADWTTDLFF